MIYVLTVVTLGGRVFELTYNCKEEAEAFRAKAEAHGGICAFEERADDAPAGDFA